MCDENGIDCRLGFAISDSEFLFGVKKRIRIHTIDAWAFKPCEESKGRKRTG